MKRADPEPPRLPLTSPAWPPGAPVPLVDRLSDAELEELNGVVRWNCFVLDGQGRRFGNAASATKRTEPQEVPDRRVTLLHERLPLGGKHVVEMGCFEGVHTIALARLAGRVTAVDSRVENVVKAIVRTALFGVHPTIFVCNVERYPLPPELACDVVLHIGVLYHLKDPITHLRALCRLAREGLLLDTHIAEPREATARFEVDGASYPYKRAGEAGLRAVFAGMYDHAKWLTLDTITGLLREGGLTKVEVVERREERNGPRVLIVASRA